MNKSEEVKAKNVISVPGTIFVIVWIPFIFYMFFQVFGWWAIVATTLFVFIAGRPAEDGGPFIWQKSIAIDKQHDCDTERGGK